MLRLNAEIREQRDAIATLRAEWAKLDAPLRLQGLAERHLELKPINATQYDQLKNLPERPPNFARPGEPDPIGAMINTIEAASDAETVTGSVPAPAQEISNDRSGAHRTKPAQSPRKGLQNLGGSG